MLTKHSPVNQLELMHPFWNEMVTSKTKIFIVRSQLGIIPICYLQIYFVEDSQSSPSIITNKPLKLKMPIIVYVYETFSTIINS